MSELLAGYISGTCVDLAHVTERQGKIRLTGQQRYVSRDFGDFDSILRVYLKRSRVKFSAACFGIAGPVIGSEVSTTNLPWHISAKDVSETFELSKVVLINDVVATAHGLSELDSEKFFTINEGHPVKKGNIGLIAAGSGLGQALIFGEGRKTVPYASEGGHADFAPGSQIESELWEYVYSEQGYVEVEDIVSLSGLERIYNFLVDTRGGNRGKWMDKADDPPLAVLEKALSGSDDTATQTVEIFIDCYASEAANLALTGMTLGGIYIGGLIAPQIITSLDKGRFMRRFVKKGKMELLLADMPVGIIIEEKTALLGAAAVALSLKT